MKTKVNNKNRNVKKEKPIPYVYRFEFVKEKTGINGDPFSILGNEKTLNIAATRGELGKAPAHYSNGKYTPWEIVDDWKLDYYCGNALKYVCRHKHKGAPVQDIQKAIDCLLKYKANLEKETT